MKAKYFKIQLIKVGVYKCAIVSEENDLINIKNFISSCSCHDVAHASNAHPRIREWLKQYGQTFPKITWPKEINEAYHGRFND